MSDSPKFTIIIPIHNVEKYLRECLDSVLRQTYSDYEVILVDDGSPDGCPSICDEYAAKDKRFSVIHQKNAGLSAARNAGLDVARGELIYFLDSDDVIEPTLLENAAVYMTSDVDLWIFNFRCMDETGTHFDAPFNLMGGHTFFEDYSPEQRAQLLAVSCMRYKFHWSAWSKVFRRSVIETFRMRFADNRIIFAEDVYFFLCYMAVASHAAVTEKAFYRYRQRESSIMGQESKEDNFDRFMKLAECVFEFYASYAPQVMPYYPAIFWNLLQYITSVSGEANNSMLKLYLRIRRDEEKYSFAVQCLRTLYRSETCLQLADMSIWERHLLRYFVTGNKPVWKLQNKLTWHYEKAASRFSDSRPFPKKTILLIGTVTSGNLGDSAINESVLLFLKNALPGYQVLEIIFDQCETYLPHMIRKMRKSTILAFAGGGNLGDQYSMFDSLRQRVIQRFPENKKIIFPQTVYFQNSINAEKAGQIYCQENHVTLFVRDRMSLDTAKKYFNCSVYVCPDIVLSGVISLPENQTRKHAALFCLRPDVEKALDFRDVLALEEFFQEQRIPVEMGDTHITGNLFPDRRKRYLKCLLNRISFYEYVVTDRMHGMIFCALTGTKCIAFDNYNNKVKGTYDFISYLPYIRYAESIDQVPEIFAELSLESGTQFDNTPLQPYYRKLKEIISE